MLGASQFVIGGAVAPLVGVFENGTPVPLASIMVVTTGGDFDALRRAPARCRFVRVVARCDASDVSGSRPWALLQASDRLRVAWSFGCTAAASALSCCCLMILAGSGALCV
jgi:hypothetical protein